MVLPKYRQDDDRILRSRLWASLGAKIHLTSDQWRSLIGVSQAGKAVATRQSLPFPYL